jgi:AcrR family transcriptional regulator
VRQAMTKEERYRHILRTAKRLFQERGYDDVTIADVIRESNIARGTFYLHFESLEALLTTLFEEVVRDTWHRIEPIINDLSIPFRECTIQVVQAVFRMFEDDDSLVNAFYSGGGQEFMKKKQEAMYDRLGALMVKALERRHDRCIPNLEWTVVMLISLVGDMAYYASIHVPKEERPQFEEKLIAFVLAGLEQHLRPYVQLNEL